MSTIETWIPYASTNGIGPRASPTRAHWRARPATSAGFSLAACAPSPRARPTRATCPKCEIDSVIGSASGYPITKEFLERINAHSFGPHNRSIPPGFSRAGHPHLAYFLPCLQSGRASGREKAAASQVISSQLPALRQVPVGQRYYWMFSFHYPVELEHGRRPEHSSSD